MPVISKERLAKQIGSSVAFARHEGMTARDATTSLMMAAALQAGECESVDADFLRSLAELFTSMIPAQATKRRRAG